MKSEFRKTKTLGSQVLETQKEHEKSLPIAAYDLAHEGGKSYMRELNDIIIKHRNKIDEYYIQVLCNKEHWARNRATYFRFFARRTEPLMEDDMDLWYINNKREEVKLMWSLPHWSDFDTFLSNPDEFDSQLIKWIKIYKKAQEKSNHKK